MEMPERVKLNNNKKLTVYIDEAVFELDEKQYLKSDKGKILLKHRTVVELAELTGTVVGAPALVHTHSPIVYVFARTATRGTKQCTEIGEANAQSLFDDIMKITPATTADNRAYERAVLKVLGIYGEVYGASEIDYRDGKPKAPSSVSKSEPKVKSDSTSNAQHGEADATVTEAATEVITTNTGKPFWWDDTGVGSFKESELNPETFVVTQGSFGGKGWTVKQLYDYQYNSCKYFAERANLDTSNEEFKKQVYACRRAIRKYGLQ